MPIKVNQADIPRKIAERLDFEGGATISYASDVIAPCILVNPNDQPVPTISRQEAYILRGRSQRACFVGKVLAAPGTVFVTQSGGRGVLYTTLTLISTVAQRVDVYYSPAANTGGSSTTFNSRNQAYSAPVVKLNDVTLGSAVIRKTITVTDNGTLFTTVYLAANTPTTIDLNILFPISTDTASATAPYHLNVVATAAATFDAVLDCVTSATREDYSEL